MRGNNNKGLEYFCKVHSTDLFSVFFTYEALGPLRKENRDYHKDTDKTKKKNHVWGTQPANGYTPLSSDAVYSVQEAHETRHSCEM